MRASHDEEDDSCFFCASASAACAASRFLRSTLTFRSSSAA